MRALQPAGMTQLVFQKSRPEQFRFLMRFYFLERGFIPRLLAVIAIAVFLVFSRGVFLYVGASFLAIILYVHITLIQTLWKTARTSPHIDLPVTLSFDDSSLTFTTSTATINQKWRSFARWSEDESYFHLFQPAAIFPTAIPKRAFTPEQQSEFIRCMAAISQTPQPNDA